jgi:hypothetical protein
MEAEIGAEKSYMDKLLFMSLLICILMVAPGSVCWAEEASPNDSTTEIGVDCDVNSLYIWRGLALSQGEVIQPSAYITMHNITATVWSNYEIAPEFAAPHHNETDLTLSYNGQWRKLEWEPSIQAFLYPRNVDAPNTAEAVLKLRYPLRSIGIFTRHSFDIISYQGSYFGEAGVDWKRKLRHNLEISASAGAGWGGTRFNETFFGLSKTALNLVSLDIALEWQITKNLSVRPHAGWSSLISHPLRELVSKPDLRVAGLAMHVGF